MTEGEFTELMIWVLQACPATKVDEGTPDVWFEMLKGLKFADAKAAVIAVGMRQKTVHPSEINEGVKAIVRDRHERNPLMEVPDYGDDDLYRPQLVAMLKAIGDGGRGLGGPLGAIEAASENDIARALDASVEARAAAYGRDPEFVRLRNGSLTVACSWCKALPGEVCTTGDGKPLTQEPAHRIRLESTEPPLVEPTPRPTKEQHLAVLRALLRAEETERD